LPADWAAWPALHLRSILAHEAAHLRARDPWILVLQTLASVLFGLNPLVWFLNRRLNHLRELRCDEIAIRASGIPPVEYGKLLYAFLERQSGPAFLSMSGISFAGNACTLTGRFLHILTLPGTDPHRRWHAALPVLLALALVPLSNSLETGSGNAGPPAPKKTPSRDVVWTFVERTPVPVKVPRPVYPEQARRAGIEGTVYSQVLVDVTGKVLDAKVVSGDRIFHESVKEAARRSLWEPALRKDEPVTVWTYFPSITFKLRESGS
jgi:TonB family protein